MNHVNLVGRLSREPLLRYSEEGLCVARYTVAIHDDYSRRADKTDFVRCVAFGRTAEIVGEHFKKDMLVKVSGKIQSGSYPDKHTGEKVYYQEVHVFTNQYIA